MNSFIPVVLQDRDINTKSIITYSLQIPTNQREKECISFQMHEKLIQGTFIPRSFEMCHSNPEVIRSAYDNLKKKLNISS